MISTPDRRAAVELIEEAVAAGARQRRACAVLGLSARTVQRWVQEGEVRDDARPTAVHPTPAHALSEAERAAVLAACHSPEYADLPPSQIVPRLADQGVYLASESTELCSNLVYQRGLIEVGRRRTVADNAVVETQSSNERGAPCATIRARGWLGQGRQRAAS
jgi:hypothetical protein